MRLGNRMLSPGLSLRSPERHPKLFLGLNHRGDRLDRVAGESADGSEGQDRPVVGTGEDFTEAEELQPLDQLYLGAECNLFWHCGIFK